MLDVLRDDVTYGTYVTCVTGLEPRPPPEATPNGRVVVS